MIDLRLPPFDPAHHARSWLDCWGNQIIPGTLIYYATAQSSSVSVNVGMVKAIINRDKEGRQVTTGYRSGTPTVKLLVHQICNNRYGRGMAASRAMKDSTLSNVGGIIKCDLTLGRILATIGVPENDVLTGPLI